MKRFLFNYGWVGLILFFIAMLFIGYQLLTPEVVDAQGAANTGSKYEPKVLNATAYCNPNGNLTYSGRPTIEGRTAAATTDWLGCVLAIYEINEDGSIGKFIGYREVEDTGYGKDGDIPRGETIDLYWGEDRQSALQWGRRKVWVQVVDGVG